MAVDLRKLVRRPSPVVAAVAPASPPSSSKGCVDGGGSPDAPSASSLCLVTTTAATTTNTTALLLLSAIVPHSAPWERGHHAHVFIDGRLVYHFIASVHMQGVDTVLGWRNAFEMVAIPLLKDLGAAYEEDDEDVGEEEEGAAAAAVAPVAPPSLTAAAPKPASKKAVVGVAATATGIKRKRPASVAEEDAADP
jgi:hypothetical protein